MFSATPNICPITYSCSLVSAAPESDPLDCNTAGVTTFDAMTQKFTFKAELSSFASYPAGTYTFKITGSVGSVPEKAEEAEYEFELELSNLCTGASMQFKAAAAPDQDYFTD
mmetsp:Transcript_20229/g.27345  ORF Transcript_20229/g.27345 Transcript_20229/m.27345 type:complete len:112 (+) Transcript_20229:1126-1461(+)